ncbi:hypothetical protein AB0I39_00900 [Kitasatospora purpeofusca]
MIDRVLGALHVSLSTVKAHPAGPDGRTRRRNRVEIAMWVYETHRILPGT